MGLSTFFPYLSKYIIDYVLIKHNLDVLRKILLITFALVALQIPLNIAISYSCAKWTQSIVLDLRVALSKIFLLQKENSGENGQFINVIVSDCESVGSLLLHITLNSVPNLFLLIMYILALLNLSVKLTLIIVFSIPIFLLITFISSKQIYGLTKQIQSYRDNLVGFLNRYVRNKLLIDLYGLNKNEEIEYKNVITKVKSTSIRSNTIMTTLNGMSSMVTVITPLITLFLGSILVFKNEITLGTLIAFNTYAGLIFVPISKILSLPPMYSQMLVSINRIIDQTTFNNTSKPKGRYIEEDFYDSTVIQVDRLVPTINQSPLPIQPISFKINQGEFVRIEGNNGIGKSIILKCLSNYYEYFQGFIYKEKKTIIAYVPQENFLFDGTIKDNLTKGLQNIDECSLSQFIKLLDFDVNIEEKTNPFVINLSSGQLQKIKIIRALLSQPDILILDEVLSNLDKTTMNNLISYLRETGITVIFVYHGELSNTKLAQDSYSSIKIS